MAVEFKHQVKGTIDYTHNDKDEDIASEARGFGGEDAEVEGEDDDFGDAAGGYVGYGTDDEDFGPED
ncbi:hypothetical protein DID88_007002 [Monilinia fructigena]|uniref:Uncharacterized protein n=1 Tax=Monilinia fructigena TaxID=38457 RepID=A0A395ILM9_9HELO|nr:hypothetical protein DID88_007002 [Monilinia fructigena]